MKTISKRFLKGGLALLLAFVMLFGTTITGFAAVIDNAETSADVDVTVTDASVDLAEAGLTIPSGSGNLVMFNNTLGWSNVYLYTRSTDLWNGNNGCTTSGLTAKTMTKISGTNYWYAYISTSYKYVLFLKDKQDNYGNVWNTSASYRADYNTSRPCFTPVPWSNQNTNSTNYYSKGSWSKYDDTTTELTIPSGSGNLVIFNNTLGWSEVYFYSKSSNFYTNSNGCSTSGMTGTLMTNISGTNYWYIYTSTTSHMLFLKAKQDGYGNVWSTEAAYKEDYNTDRQIFTPSTTAVESTNSTSYYSNGTWSKYAPAATKYTVEFVDYDGRVISTQEVEEGKTPTAPANPTREGYTFAGWSPTVGAITGDTTYTATYNQNTYALTITESGATGGKFTVDGATFTSGSNVTHGTHTLGVTAPAGYKIKTLDGTTVGAATGSKSISVTAAKTVAVVYEADNKCSTSFSDTSTMNLVLGEEKTRTATLSHCTSGGTVNYSSSDTTVATVDANGKVKALKAGTTTITAKCSKGDEGSSATYTVRVNNPTFKVNNVTVDVNGTVTAVPTIEANEPDGTYSYEFTSHSSNNNYYAVNETTGVITGQKPTTSCLVSATLVYNNTNVATASFSVKVNEPEANLSKTTAKILTGQTVQLSVDSNITPESISWSKDTVVTVNTNGLVSTTADTGTGNVTATVNYNEFYSKELTCAVTVASPTLTVSPATLNLEIGGGTTTGTVTVTNNDDTAGADGTDAVDPVLEVESSKSDVATATVVDGKINVTAKAVGTTTLTVSYRNVTKTVTVNVSQYDPYVYLYVTDSQDWGNMFLHSWKGSNSNVTTLGQSDAQMIYIGLNGDEDKVFAYRFLKGSEPEKVIMVKTNSWPSDNLTRTDDYAVDFSKGYAALYIDSTTNSSGRRNTGDWTDDCMIVRPTVSVDDLTVVMGETGTAEATVANGDKVLWTIGDTTYATVADVDTQTATVTSVAPGTTEISARAFVDTANSSIKTLPTNYTTDTACWPFISTEAIATVTVDPGSARQIKVASSYSDNGTDYSTGVTGGTVNATYDTQSGTSLEVPYNGEYTITATPKDGYAFNGWTKNNVAIDGDATLTVAAKDDANYVAKFVKTYTVTVATPAGIDSIKINNAPGTTYTAKAGETITVYGSPADGYRLGDWTVTGTATATDTNTATATISNIQSNITVTPSAVEIFSVTYTQYVNRVKANVGTVTVNGDSANGEEFDKGTEVTLTATSSTRSFYGWYAADDTNFETPLSTDATYVINSLDSNIDVVAMFYRPFTIEGEVPGEQVVLTYDIVTDTYTGTSNGYTGNAFTVKDTFGNTVSAANVNVTGGTHTGATVTGNANGYTLVPDTENYDTSAPITYTMRHMGTGTYYLDIALSTADKVEISVNGTKVADKAIGSKFSYEITAPSGQYLSGATTNPAVDFEIVDGVITFTVPETNVNIVPEFSNYSYVVISNDVGVTHDAKSAYKAGEEVTITLSPSSEATTITNVVSDNDSAVVVQNGDSWTVTISSMPADTTITLTPTVDAKFVMSYDMKAIGNYGTGYTTYGTVSMKIGETTLAKGGYAGPTDTVTYTATPNANFIFDGWYSDSECSLSKLLSRNTSYDVKPTADTTVYALFVPKHYLAYDQAQTGTYVTMTYVPEDRAFEHESSTIAKDAWFRVTNYLNGWNDSNSYSQFGSEFAVNFNGNGYNLNIDWGTQCYRITDGSDKDYPFTIVVTLDGNESIDVSARTVKTGNTVLLSSGRNNIGYATTTVITEGLTSESKSVSHDGDTENYLKIKNLPIEGQTLTWETTIGGTNASGLYIDSYIVYSMDTGLWEVIEPVSLGNNKYQGTALIDSDTYIAPVFFHTDEYNEANGLVAIELYFDASAIKNLKWGPFVSCYSWSADESVKYFGSWPGQLMIPTPDGKSYYTQLDVPAAGSANPAAGVTFNNYMFGTCPVQEGGLFGVTTQNIQTYDYREAVTLYESNYDVITFVAKTSYDGYHGDEPNGVDHNPVSESTTPTQLFDNFEFDYLYRRDGVTPMNFNGDEVVGPKPVNAADYYIVSKGDRDINAGGYTADIKYNGNWSVEWYIFDKNGNYKTKVLSTALWHDTDMTDDDRQTVLLNALGLTPEQAADKTVAISYELANHADGDNHKLAYDGQWYGNYLQDKIKADVKVGFQNANGTFTVNPDAENPNIADYGEGYLVDADGSYHQTLDVLIDYGAVDLHADIKEGYAFVGWFTMQADGTFKKIGNSFDFHTYHNMAETYYAMFRTLGEGEVVINHTVYNNPNDPAIPSHGGVSEMYVEVRDSQGNLVSNGIPSTSRSSASFKGTENETYTITITTTPLMNGEFFAWYTDSTNVDGTKTYEEVFTDASQIGSTTKVTATFEYTYTLDSQKVINIYSDVKRVTNSATLLYKYYNRFGELRTYTVKDVPLTDDECLGFVGNGGNAYVPAYLTAYTFMDKGGNEVVVYGEDRYNEYIANGSEYRGSYNKISAYAPKSDVTEVFDGTVVWDVADTQLTTERSLVTLFASQGVPTYTINYKIGDQSGSKTDFYNELIKVEAPATYDGDAFSYWYEPATGEILTYSRFYNYRIVEDKTIVAVFGETNLQEWVPSINSITKTREFADGGDYIYTDHLLAFNNVDGKVLKDVQADEKIEYGLMILRDADYYIEDADNVVYPDATDEKIAARLKTIASDRKKNSSFTEDNNKYNCYFYNLSDNDLTNFNRLDYYVKYDNNKLVDTDHKYREFAFTAVAYINIDGTVYLSKPKTTNFFELGNQAVTDSTN